MKIPQTYSFEGEYFATISLITSPAMINPATEGTNETLPGICLLVVQSFSSLSMGFIAGSFEYTTFRESMPLFLNSERIVLARGQMLVL